MRVDYIRKKQKEGEKEELRLLWCPIVAVRNRKKTTAADRGGRKRKNRKRIKKRMDKKEKE